ncbi:MAG: HAMP domain-containing histidine kinase [Rickettsiales bacterium]|jgi:two-component system cell cycle sensor histidine kinase PleC|nr:HAMP domain-containing histidine kinase [Rickettsiales bacterium]
MFNFLRLFSIISLIAIAVIAVFAGMSVRSIAVDNLRQQIEQNSSNIAQGYIYGVWVKYHNVIVPLASDPDALRASPEVKEFAKDTLRYFQQMPLVRVNIYNADGRLLMTSNADGRNKPVASSASPDGAFVAKQFAAATIGSYWLETIALDTNPEATLLQTVIPIRMQGAAGIEGALEVIHDISKPWGHIKSFQLYGTGAIIGVFLVFLGILFFSSRKAEAIIARQYETNVELAATAEAAQAENRQKSQFLANISHELRTPLNAIIGFSDIIKNEVISALENKKYHDYINDIHSSGVHLLSLINDILDYSKAEAGKLELEAAEVNVTKLVQNSMRLVAPRAETGKVTLTDALPKEQIIMVTDSKKFKQILLNLLSNAVKFTQAGGEVKITAWRDLASDMYFFEVKDSGIGIAPKDISKAMAPFGQVDSALNRKYEGTGLGLPLTKKFVEIMGGNFTIESTVGKGTTVTFSLPRELKERDGVIVKQVT